MGAFVSASSRVFVNPFVPRPNDTADKSAEFGYGAFFERRGDADSVPYFEPPLAEYHSTRFDLRDQWGTSYPPIQTQGKIGACTAFAVCGAMECVSRLRQLMPLWSLSAFSLYAETLRASHSNGASGASGPGRAVRFRIQPAWQQTHDSNQGFARVPFRFPDRTPVFKDSEAIPITDTGSTTNEALRAATTRGVPAAALVSPELPWNTAETPEMRQSAQEHRVRLYARVHQDIASIRGALLNGLPVLITIGITARANEWMHSAALQRPTYILPTPWGPQDIGDISGAHAVLLVGYDDVARVFTVRNSWGPAWGADGHFFLTYETVLTPLWCRDFYVVQDLVA